VITAAGHSGLVAGQRSAKRMHSLPRPAPAAQLQRRAGGRPPGGLESLAARAAMSTWDQFFCAGSSKSKKTCFFLIDCPKPPPK